jgi:hypothetical protein
MINVKLTINDNRTHELFQLLWIAIKRTELKPTLWQLMTMQGLMGKLSTVSKIEVEGVCTPIHECELVLSDDERVLCLAAIQQVPWEDVALANGMPPAEMMAVIRDLCTWLGAEVVPSVVDVRAPEVT